MIFADMLLQILAEQKNSQNLTEQKTWQNFAKQKFMLWLEKSEKVSFHIFLFWLHNKNMKKEKTQKKIKNTKESAQTDKVEKTEEIAKNSKNAKKIEKNAKKTQKKCDFSEKPEKKEKKKSGFLWFLGVAGLSVALLVVCQFFLESYVSGNQRFYENTKINGIDVGGMSVAEAENVVLTDMLESRKDIEIQLTAKDKTWTLSGSDFEVANKLRPQIREISKIGHKGNFFQNLFEEKKVKQEGKNFELSYTNVLADFGEKVEEIAMQVEQESRPASLVFQPTGEEAFVVDKGQNTILVNRDLLLSEIDNALKTSKKVKIEIPIIEIEQQIDVEDLKNSIVKRSEFSTSYATSSAARKNNVRKAIESFNGLVVEPGQTISFNETTGARTEENGYKNAHIIVGGVYVDGVGGGVCQASTTLYNALLLADVEILSVNHHSLPASYVPLSFDAMVSGSYSDLVFKNTLENPIFIRTYANDSEIRVEIYGERFEDGVEIKRRAELVKILPHNGDKILGDFKGEFSNKILYKGEYYRVKYPREGYESKGFLQYYKNGKLVEEKEIRHDFYQPQDGIVMEGVEVAAEGMTIPPSDVTIIKPQKVTKSSEENVRKKLEKTSPSEFNP